MKKRICRVCSTDNIKTEFKPNVNICKRCNAIYMQDYREKNRRHLSAHVQRWKKKNHKRYRAAERAHYHTPEGKAKHIARVTKTPRTWLSHLLGRTKATAKKPGPHDPKSGPKRDFNIDLDYVCRIWDKQDGICPITHLRMAHRFNRLDSASIDRIDPNKGHVRGNIQIVCQAVNMAKRHRTNREIKTFFSSAALSIINHEGIVCD